MNMFQCMYTVAQPTTFIGYSEAAYSVVEYENIHQSYHKEYCKRIIYPIRPIVYASTIT